MSAMHGIGIEIVVDVEAVDVVAAHDVFCHLIYILAVLGLCWVEDKLSVVGEHARRALYGHMVRSQLHRALGLGAVGVDPCVELHAASVALVYHPFEGVPIGRRRLALLAREVAAPRLYVALVEGVTLGSHLKDDGVDPVFLQLVELMCERLLHGLCGHALKLPVHTLYPRSAKLAFVTVASFRHGPLRRHDKEKQQEKK